MNKDDLNLNLNLVEIEKNIVKQFHENFVLKTLGVGNYMVIVYYTDMCLYISLLINLKFLKT